MSRFREMRLRYRLIIVVLLALPGGPLLAEETTEPAVSTEGFKMTGMARDTVAKETPAMTFKGMQRQTATRVFKETTEKNQ